MVLFYIGYVVGFHSMECCKQRAKCISSSIVSSYVCSSIVSSIFYCF